MSADGRWLAMPALVARFLHDPLALPRPDASARRTAGAPEPAELTGAHLPHALAAQAHALAGRHRQAGEAMQRALVLIEAAAADRLRTTADWVHLRTLASLAQAFIAREASLEDPAGALGNAPLAQALQRCPDLSYLWRLQAERHAQLARVDEAIDSLDRADALGPASLTPSHAAMATAWALAHRPADLPLLQRVARRFFRDGPPPGASGTDRGLAAFWHGRLLLGMAEAAAAGAGEAAQDAARTADAVRQARLAIERLHQAELLLTGEAAQAAASWAEQARRQLPADEPIDPAMIAVRLERAQASAAAGLLGAGGLPSWRGLAQAIAQLPAAPPEGPSPMSLLVPVLRELRRADPRHLPSSQRIRLALPANLLPDEAASVELIGAARRTTAPSLAHLRRMLLRCFGVELPGVLVSGDAPSLSIAVDGVRIAALPMPLGPQRLCREQRTTAAAGASGPAAGRRASAGDWFGRPVWLEPVRAQDDAGTPGSLFAGVFASVHLLRCLDRFVGMRDLTRLALPVAHPGPVLTMLRLLAADRTPLIAAELAEPARFVDSRELTPLEGVRAYRARPVIMRRLWGARDDRLTPHDFDDAPGDLAARLSAALPAADVPDRLAGLPSPLVDAVMEWAEQHLKGPCCVRVRDGALRTWLRALLRPRWPDVPVLTIAEHAGGLPSGRQLSTQTGSGTP